MPDENDGGVKLCSSMRAAGFAWAALCSRRLPAGGRVHFPSVTIFHALMVSILCGGSTMPPTQILGRFLWRFFLPQDE